MLQSVYRRLNTLFLSIGVTVVNESAVPPRLNMADQPLLHEMVCETWRKYLAKLWVGHSADNQAMAVVAQRVAHLAQLACRIALAVKLILAQSCDLGLDLGIEEATCATP